MRVRQRLLPQQDQKIVRPEGRPEERLPPGVVRLVRNLLTQQRSRAPRVGDQPAQLGRRRSLIGPRGALWVVRGGDEEGGAGRGLLPLPLECRLQKTKSCASCVIPRWSFFRTSHVGSATLFDCVTNFIGQES